MRRVDGVVVRRFGAYVVMDIQANAFLLHMVRNLASALRSVGAGDLAATDIQALFQDIEREVFERLTSAEVVTIGHSVTVDGRDSPCGTSGARRSARRSCSESAARRGLCT